MPDPTVSALVVLRPAGEATEPITAANLAEHRPAAADAARAAEWFAGQGFQVGPLVGISFAIAGPRSLFERLYGAATGEELPLDALPPEVARSVRAVGFSPPPEFGR